MGLPSSAWYQTNNLQLSTFIPFHLTFLILLTIEELPLLLRPISPPALGIPFFSIFSETLPYQLSCFSLDSSAPLSLESNSSLLESGLVLVTSLTKRMQQKWYSGMYKARTKEALQLPPRPLGTLTLGLLKHHVMCLPTLSPSFCEKTQASHAERLSGEKDVQPAPKYSSSQLFKSSQLRPQTSWSQNELDVPCLNSWHQ